ncbi:MAG: PaaI family thioesterase [Myxococcota bacterium]|nr:PaaI family thioesterase [Myxococcota bacterium]
MSESSRPTPEQLAHYAQEFSNSVPLKAFGCRLQFPTQDRVVVEIDPLLPHHRGGLGTDAVNGGVLAAMFDLAIGTTPALRDTTRRNATMQLSMTFERPLRGNKLRAEAWIETAGSSTMFSAARILDEHGVVVARCQGVVKLSQLKWKAGGSPAVGEESAQ